MSKFTKKSIPLLCMLCPKEPHFSDISHLLTHISSKSHLSHRFKLQIRSQAEPEAREQLDNFETWYSENGLDDLLSDRLATKEHKKMAKKPRATPIPPTQFEARPRHDVKRETKSEVKMENKKASILSATPKYRAPIPRMHTWSTSTPAINSVLQESTNQYRPDSGYETPKTYRPIPNFGLQVSSDRDSTVVPELAPPRQEGTDDEKYTDTSKLKGILWPGMDLFDSATIEMKRKRNQKKDGSVLAQMILSSAIVEPTEWVFNADGEFHKMRSIFGDSTDTSPVKSDVEPSPKRRHNRNAPHANLDPSSPAYGSLANFSPTRVGRKSGAPALDASEVSRRLTAHPMSPFTTQFSPSAEEDEEFRITMEDMTKRQPFGIFRDAEEGSPSRTESPFEGSRFSFAYDNLPLKPTNSNSLLTVSNTPVFKPIPIRFSDKENLQGQNFHRCNVQPTTSYPPQMFHDHSVNPLLFQSHTHIFPYENHPYLYEDLKPLQSSFNGDFKPIMLASAPQVPGHVQSVKRSPPGGDKPQFRM